MWCSSPSPSPNSALSVATTIFAVSSLIYVRRIRKAQKETSFSSCSSGSSQEIIGTRGKAALAPPLPYLNAFFKCLEDPCHTVDNPEGYIALCVAENKLITGLFRSYLTREDISKTAFSDESVYCYNDFLGLPQTRDAVAYFLARKFLCPSNTITVEGALELVKAEDVVLGSGCAGLLNNLFYALAEEKDAVLIPAPYYCAFENDMKVIAKCVPIPVYLADPARGPTAEELEVAAIDAEKQGLRVKFLLLTNPNNPLGVVYTPKVILDSIKWSRDRKMHILVDEIYALSVRKENGDNFQSVMKILDNKLGNDVHFLWALSKDFGSSGFRVGVLYTQNKLLVKALGNLNLFSGVSHPVQAMTAKMLSDDVFVDKFLDDSRDLLENSYLIATKYLDYMGVSYVPAAAGMFVYCDFSSFLPTQTFDGEAEFADLVQNLARVVMTPGQCQRDTRPGMFRICYAWISPEILRKGMERLQFLSEKINDIGWEKLRSLTFDNETILRKEILQWGGDIPGP